MIWAFGQPDRLRPATLQAIEDLDNDVVVSVASGWEAAIKIRAGRLTLPVSLGDAIAASRYEELEIRVEHALAAADLPLHHKDPFDRMLIAQAQLESLTIVTRDRRFAAYDVALLPA
jgi:PIN domain nuclease of toxin-antitoxin system